MISTADRCIRLDHGLGLEELNFADLGVELSFDFTLVAEGSLCRRNHRVFQSADQNALIDALFLTYLFNDTI